MANRNWGRAAMPSYGGYGMQSGFNYFGVGQQSKDARPYNAPRYPSSGNMTASSGGYRNDNSNYYRRNDRKDDPRGTKRPMKGRSPDRRQSNNFPPKKDSRSFSNKRPLGGNYEVRVPKHLFGMKNMGASEIRHRHNRINVAGDVYEVENSWVDAFPIHTPIKLNNLNDFHVFHREVENPDTADASFLNAPDADYAYSARVMLLGCPQLAELYKQSCRFADEPSSTEKSAPSKQFTFLIGGRAKNETSAVGGPWSPSMDGADPGKNPQTLIRTAIRTFKGFTGIDLSGCSEWTRFMEIRYFRRAGTKAPVYTSEEDERDITEDKVETVVFFIPNLAHLLPTEEAWEQTKEVYNSMLQKLLNPEDDKATEEEEEKSETKDVNMTQTENNEELDESTGAPTNAEATHYSKLDLASMKVQDLKDELVARGLDAKGLKAQLSARLQTALDEEKAKDSSAATVAEDKPEAEGKTEQTPTKTETSAPESSQEKAESKQLSEKERRRLERLYRLGDKPTILIHPNKAARGGRFDCHRVTLHALLEYRSDEMKEPNFEVALFAEQFHEMMQRDCAFNIFKAIYKAPEKEQKTEQNGKINGTAEDTDEPDNKRVKTDGEENHDEDTPKIRTMRKTTHPHLLFSFNYFDTGYIGYIKEHDMCEILHMLGMNYSRTQMKNFVGKVIGRRDSIQYRTLTDGDVVEGDVNDVVNMETAKDEIDHQTVVRLSVGNRAFLGVKPAPQPSIIAIGGGNRDAAMQRVEAAESARKKLEYQFFQIKDELEKTRTRLNGCKDIEDKLRADNQKLSSQYKTEQKECSEARHLYNTYSHLVRVSHDYMGRAIAEINKQYEREKAKREAERAAEEAQKAAAAAAKKAAEEDNDPETAAETDEAKPANGEVKTEEKDWDVVDTA